MFDFHKLKVWIGLLKQGRAFYLDIHSVFLDIMEYKGTKPSILFKFGRIKSWIGVSEELEQMICDIATLETAYVWVGYNDKQKELACKIIDQSDSILGTWLDNRVMTKEEAKLYIKEFNND